MSHKRADEAISTPSLEVIIVTRVCDGLTNTEVTDSKDEQPLVKLRNIRMATLTV